MIKNGWLTRSDRAKSFLYRVIKVWSPDKVKKVILDLEEEGYTVDKINDVTSRITLCVMINRCKEYQEQEKPENTKEAEKLMKDLVKDVLDD